MLITLVVLVVVFVVLTARLFVWPDTNAPACADAVIVLNGGGNPPARAALELVKEGYAPLLVVSAYPGERCPARFKGVAVRCFVPNPYSTRGEARDIERLSKKLDFHRIIVVVSTPEATRARLRIGRCYRGRVLIYGVSPGNLLEWAVHIVYEWGALMKALVLQPGC